MDDVAIRDFITYAYGNWQGPPVSYLLLVGEANLDVKNYLGASSHFHIMPTHLGVTASLGETPSEQQIADRVARSRSLAWETQ